MKRGGAYKRELSWHTANFFASGLKRQDNDLVVIESAYSGAKTGNYVLDRYIVARKRVSTKSGLKRQVNDLIVIESADAAAAFSVLSTRDLPAVRCYRSRQRNRRARRLKRFLAKEYALQLFPLEIEIAADEGFAAHDIFGRKDFGDQLTRIVRALEIPSVLLLDAPWGTGKTTFVKMWRGDLTKAGIPSVYFDAFANDYQEDAFLAVASQIIADADSRSPRRKKALDTFKAKALQTAKVIGRASLTLKEAQGLLWIPMVEEKFAVDREFREISGHLVEALRNGDAAPFLDNDLPYEEWLAILSCGQSLFPKASGSVLRVLAREHFDDGVRFNSVQLLDDADQLAAADIETLLKTERDPENAALLREIRA